MSTIILSSARWSIVLTIVTVLGCSADDTSMIPSDATYLGGKFPIHQRCVRQGPAVKCQIWIRGNLDRDEIFKPIDNDPPPDQEELDRISTASGLNRHMWVFLDNRRLLVPLSEYQFSAEVIDRDFAAELDPDRRWCAP